MLARRPRQKAFNHTPSCEILTHEQPAGTAGRQAIEVHADDTSARDQVVALIDEVGFDGGPLAEAQR